MLDIKCPKRRNPVFLLIAIGALCLALSCAPSPTKKQVSGLTPETPAQIESINVVSPAADAEARIAITNSRTTPYTAFKLVQPLRLIVDVTAQPAEELAGPDVVGDRIIKALTFEGIKDEPSVTRIIATLHQDVEYSVQEKDGIIDILLSPKQPAATVEPPVMASKEEALPEKPRLFFAPSKTKANQILGIDFFMLPKGKSRITVTTKERAPYELIRKDPMTLLLAVKEVTIRPELTRYIDASYFKGVVNRITPLVRVADQGVDLEVKLREAVPYHVVQTDQEIRIDFSKTSVRPPAKTITGPRLSERQVVERKTPEQVTPSVTPAVTPAVSQPGPFERKVYRKYTGERVTLDFANADIRNILKLIGEVSKLNLIWGPEVKGTVSMRLKNVPWDQALDIVLESNDLGMIREGNIIWVTTKGKIKNLEKERQDKLKAEQERIKAAKAAEDEMKAAEPLVEECLVINYRPASGVAEKLTLTERGTKVVDERTKTICITDTATSIQRAKQRIKELDIPVKQVMIEARIVEAKTTFSRDLGINWVGGYSTKRSPWGGGGPDSSRSYDYSFATNFTAAADTAIGLSFANASGTMSSVITAQISLAETEGTLKTLSAPKIITRDTVQATIKQGTTIYIPYTDIDGNRTAKEVDATLELSVTPIITPNNMVTMKIAVSDDFPDYANRVGEFVPVLTKNATTEMMVASGDTVVIGGIYKESKGITDTGTPWLRKIPIIGWFFGVENKTTEKSELLIFLTPRVVPVTPMS